VKLILPKQEMKCVAVQLPIHLVQKLDEYREKTGKSKNAILVEFIAKGLNSTTEE